MQFQSLIGHTQELLDKVLESNLPADSLIDTFFRSHKYLGSHDRRFIAETTYGLLRHLRKCEFLLNYLTKNLKKEIKQKEKRFLLIIIYLISVDKPDISETYLEQFVKGKFINEDILKELITGLRQNPEIVGKDIIETMGIKYSYPDWMIEYLHAQYGQEECEKICDSLNQPAPLNLRVNILKTTVDECKIELEKEGVITFHTNFSPFGLTVAKRINVFSLKAFRNGWFEVQDEGSQLIPLIVDPKPNAKLLDLCAGAGGKTLEFSMLMKNRGEIFATDINKFRLEELRKRAKRAGAQNIRVKQIKDVSDLSDQYAEYFDIVFIDSPCTGLGTIRRNPGMKWKITKQTLSEICKKQASLLSNCDPLLKKGGRLIYATCSILKEENEEQIEKFLSLNSNYQLIKLNEKLKDSGIQLIENDCYMKLMPHIHGTDGFFCAVIEKKIEI